MKKDKIIEELKILQEVKPDKGFVKSTKKIVLSVKPHKKFIPIWAAGLALGAVILALVGSSLIFSMQKPRISSSLNKEFLAQ